MIKTPGGSFDHLCTNPEKYARKPGAQGVIIYGPIDRSPTAEDRQRLGSESLIVANGRKFKLATR
jgi:hypothetical protein